MRYIFIALVVIFCGNVSAQKLKGLPSYAEAVQEAKRLDKPLMLFVEFYKGGVPPNLPPGARILPNAIDDKDVIALLEKNYVVYRTLRQDPSIAPLIAKYNIQRFPAFLFFHPGGDFFYSDYVSSNTKGKYFSMVDDVMAAANEKTLSQLEIAYKDDKTNMEILRQLISKRINQGLTNNAELIEQYVGGLKMADFNDYSTVLFILKAGPFADGVAYKLARTNRAIIDSLYKKEALAVRTTFTTAIVTNTMEEAIRTKSRIKAEAAANFSRSSWGNDYLKGQQAYGSRMIQYYHAVKDTASYLRTAGSFYDQFFMATSAATIKKTDSTNLQKMVAKTAPPPAQGVKVVSKSYMDSVINASKNAKLPANIDTSKLIKRVQTYQTYTINSGVNYNTYAYSLNEAAWNFYLTETKNLNYLTKAMLWSRRSIELNPLANYYDTLAHLLYRLGYYSEAENTQKTAISVAKKALQNTDEFQATLKKMRTKTL